MVFRWFRPHPPGSRDQQAEKSTDEHGDGSTAEPCPGSDQPRMEARAVHNETRWTNSSPAATSQQQLIQRDRQIADADARGMIDGVGDGGSGADDPEFANPLRTHGIDMQILFIDPG